MNFIMLNRGNFIFQATVLKLVFNRGMKVDKKYKISAENLQNYKH